MAVFPQAECLSFIKNDTKIPIHISKYGGSMAKESAQKGHFHVLQLNSHRITLTLILFSSPVFTQHAVVYSSKDY